MKCCSCQGLGTFRTGRRLQGKTGPAFRNAPRCSLETAAAFLSSPELGTISVRHAECEQVVVLSTGDKSRLLASRGHTLAWSLLLVELREAMVSCEGSVGSYHTYLICNTSIYIPLILALLLYSSPTCCDKENQRHIMHTYNNLHVEAKVVHLCAQKERKDDCHHGPKHNCHHGQLDQCFEGYDMLLCFLARSLDSNNIPDACVHPSASKVSLLQAPIWPPHSFLTLYLSLSLCKSCLGVFEEFMLGGSSECAWKTCACGKPCDHS